MVRFRMELRVIYGYGNRVLKGFKDLVGFLNLELVEDVSDVHSVLVKVFHVLFWLEDGKDLRIPLFLF